MPKFRFHDLRSTWASFLVMAGTPVRLVQDLGGWASLSMVQRYSHLRPEQRVDAIARLDFGKGVRESTAPPPRGLAGSVSLQRRPARAG
jgi:integrase